MGGAAGQDDRHVRFRHVHAFVQDVRGDYAPVATLPEAVQDLFSLPSRGLVSDTRYEEPLAERVNFLDALGEDDAAIVPVFSEQVFERHAFTHRAALYLPPPSRRQERLPASGVAGGGHQDEALPVFGRAHRESMFLQKVPVHGVSLGVFEPLVGRELYRDANQLVRGEVGPGQILRRAPVADFPDQVR